LELSSLEIDVSHEEVTMSSAKEQIAKILQDQPDDSSYDELLRELAFARMIDRGLADSDAGKTISHEEMGRRIKTWQS
jgi:predicted transcriptional regulator